ncbi:glycosyltransferase family 9 protein [Burkholderia mayonis]|uniref:ADP-heptose--LPS heptosyltransferase n=1 Tax=Burkholderia mayonis TaxID=1385591 RepID=A0A1B4FWB6_9BURK|nr:glycosyltransferase family 9 protein [Burkholderia mayonis]AOJ07901.1 ADP-heptose--LPS heptosyltransferase [Burkholderia mayonis]KVE55405.1 ADP-heptose--LPS heptosyltransferase [Burkholderia mayonis]
MSRDPSTRPVTAARRGAGEYASVAVFRALQLGDMLCAVPALRALRRGEPQARITLIGLPWAKEFAERFSDYVDDFIEFPGAPGLAEQPDDVDRLAAFVAECRSRRFDLAIQLHGSGGQSNAIVAGLGAASTAGFTPGALASADTTAPRLDCAIPWPSALPEIGRCMKLMRKLGYDDWGDYLEFPLGGLDYAICRVLCEQFELQPLEYAVVHPGARMQSRRWPVARFARVARALVDRGLRIVLTGARGEASLVGEFGANLGRPFIDLCGRAPLGALAALIGRSRLVVCNDTGVSHVAAALGAPSVVIACGSDVARWAPLDRERHHVLADYPPCRPCTFETCPYDHPCATAIRVEDVVRRADELLAVEPHHVA